MFKPNFTPKLRTKVRFVHYMCFFMFERCNESVNSLTYILLLYTTIYIDYIYYIYRILKTYYTRVHELFIKHKNTFLMFEVYEAYVTIENRPLNMLKQILYSFNLVQVWCTKCTITCK